MGITALITSEVLSSTVHTSDQQHGNKQAEGMEELVYKQHRMRWERGTPCFHIQTYRTQPHKRVKPMQISSGIPIQIDFQIQIPSQNDAEIKGCSSLCEKRDELRSDREW